MTSVAPMLLTVARYVLAAATAISAAYSFAASYAVQAWPVRLGQVVPFLDRVPGFAPGSVNQQVMLVVLLAVLAVVAAPFAVRGNHGSLRWLSVLSLAMHIPAGMGHSDIHWGRFVSDPPLFSPAPFNVVATSIFLAVTILALLGAYVADRWRDELDTLESAGLDASDTTAVTTGRARIGAGVLVVASLGTVIVLVAAAALRGAASALLDPLPWPAVLGAFGGLAMLAILVFLAAARRHVPDA